MQKKSEDYDDDGSHNSAFKTLQLSIRGGVIDAGQTNERQTSEDRATQPMEAGD